MSRLPIVGEDNNTWGTVLNEYLSVEHNEDGTQKLLTESVSRTIYVSATGDDTTGDGSELLPYLTIGKALSTIKKEIIAGVTITINVGAGTFTITQNDYSVISSIKGKGTLEFTGVISLVESGFTMGAAVANDAFSHSVSGGSTGSWSANQWRYYLLKSGSNYYPITHNTTTTLSIAGTGTGNEIYQIDSILDASAITTISTIESNMYSLKFTYINFSFAGSPVLDGNSIIFTTCKFTSTGRILSSQNQITRSVGLYRCSFDGTKFSMNGSDVVINNNYFNYSSNTPLLAINTLANTIEDSVFENDFVEHGSCIYVDKGGSLSSKATSTVYTKFINSAGPLRYSRMAITIDKFICPYDKMILVNCDHIFQNYNSSVIGNTDPIEMLASYSNIYGTVNVSWFGSPMYEFVNLSSGRNVQFTGIVYPEFEQGLSSTLADNTTTQVIIGNKLQNRSIIIDYTITRGTTVETARLLINNDGTNLTLQEGTPLGDVGVTFAVNFNTNEIRLACTLTSTGTAATLKYNATRVMITPLTI
ncbi:MAG TPA: hypothetical protein VK153_03005 [Candidatus Paceibacterota bacterium]|nr:hypothetical protein [Candidatus Paceibacterota bacterium]